MLIDNRWSPSSSRSWFPNPSSVIVISLSIVFHCLLYLQVIGLLEQFFYFKDKKIPRSLTSSSSRGIWLAYTVSHLVFASSLIPTKWQRSCRIEASSSTPPNLWAGVHVIIHGTGSQPGLSHLFSTPTEVNNDHPSQRGGDSLELTRRQQRKFLRTPWAGLYFYLNAQWTVLWKNASSSNLQTDIELSHLSSNTRNSKGISWPKFHFYTWYSPNGVNFYPKY